MFGIGFLNTVFLAALGATLLPVVIHILNRRRIRRLPFSSLRFLEEISQRRMRTISVRRALILVLRTLAVLFLVLAFARPVMRGAASLFLPGAAPVYSVICLDTSYSMGVEREQGTAFSLAQAIAADVVDHCGARDRLNLVLFSSSSEAVFEEGTLNKQLVKDAIREASVSQMGTDLGGAIARAVELITASRLSRGEIYVVSDFRASHDTTAVPQELERIGLVLLPVYREAVDNASIDRIDVPRKLIRPGELMKVGVVVTNHSLRQQARFPLELVLDGKRKAEKQIDLSPASSITVTFPLSLPSCGHYHCLARKTRDRLGLDDERAFLLDVSRSVPVTVVSGGAGTGPEEESTFYLSKALNPRNGEGGEFTVSLVSERAVTASDLPRAGVVVWADPGPVERSRMELITRYVRAGGALALFLDGSGTGALADRRLLAFIGVAHAAPRELAAGSRLSRFRSDHPVFSLFDPEELELLSRSVVQRYAAVRGVAEDSVLAYLDNGDPYLWEVTRGRGRVLVFASAPDLDHGNLPLSPMFLPVIHTSVSFLADAAVSEPDRDGIVGDPLRFDLPAGMQMASRTLEVSRDGAFYGRPQVAEIPSGGMRALLEAPERAGFYVLAADTQVIAEHVLNPDPAESDLNPADIGTLTASHARIVERGSRFDRDLLEARQGKEIFALFLALALAALAAESLLGRKA